MAPLSGIKVVELSTYVAAPSCARLLADLGASVIKVESFSGDPWRTRGKNLIRRGDEENPIFEVYNTGKESICINIKQEKGLECILRLLATADVFITNTRTRSLKKLGLDAETLAKRFPRLVIASVDGFGPLGPEAESPGFDNVAFWTRSGFLQDMVIETEGGYPIMPPTGCGDSVAGNVMATGILTALYNREKTGHGDIVSASLYGTAIWAMSSMLIRTQEKYGERFPMKREEMNPFSCQYKCSDGAWICITILEYDKYATTLYKLLNIEDKVEKLNIIDYDSMQKNRGALIKFMEKSFASKPIDVWISELNAANIVCGRMTHFRDVSTDEQALVNGFIEKYQFRNGESCAMPCPPIRLASYKTPKGTTAPMVGENTDIVLTRLGYSEEEMKELHECGAVK